MGYVRVSIEWNWQIIKAKPMKERIKGLQGMVEFINIRLKLKKWPYMLVFYEPVTRPSYQAILGTSEPSSWHGFKILHYYFQALP